MDTDRHAVVVGALVRDERGRCLLVRHHRRGWEIPQGRVEAGETLLGALSREVREETGVSITPGPLACVWSKVTPPAALVFTFLAAWREGVARPSAETPEVGWFTPEEAVALVTHPVNRDRLLPLLSFAGNTSFRAYATSPYRLLDEPSRD